MTFVPQCRGDMTKTYSLEAYDNWFNCLSMLVATEVCRVSVPMADMGAAPSTPVRRGAPAWMLMCHTIP